MSGKQASSKKKSSKVVNVELEKLTEQNSVKPATTRAPPELVASIKNTAQLEEESIAKQQLEELEQIEATQKRKKPKKREKNNTETKRRRNIL